MNSSINKANVTVLVAALVQVAKAIWPDLNPQIYDGASAVLLWLAVYFIPNKENTP